VSDNTVLVTPPNSTNADTIRDLDRGGGIKTPVVQLDVGGASGNAESLVSASNPLPVTGTVVTTPPAHASANIDQIGGAALTEGQKAMAASVPVVIASDQSAVPVSGTVGVSNFPATQPISAVSLPLPTNAAQETGGNLAAIAASDATVVTLLTFMQQLVDLNTKILAVLQATRLQHAAAYGAGTIEPDQMIPDPTFG
jgi:hypothetical protein